MTANTLPASSFYTFISQGHTFVSSSFEILYRHYWVMVQSTGTFFLPDTLQIQMVVFFIEIYVVHRAPVHHQKIKHLMKAENKMFLV